MIALDALRRAQAVERMIRYSMPECNRIPTEMRVEAIHSLVSGRDLNIDFEGRIIHPQNSSQNSSFVAPHAFFTVHTICDAVCASWRGILEIVLVGRGRSLCVFCTGKDVVRNYLHRPLAVVVEPERDEERVGTEGIALVVGPLNAFEPAIDLSTKGFAGANHMRTHHRRITQVWGWVYLLATWA